MAEPSIANVERGYSQMDDDGAKPPRQYKDVEWTVIFLVQFALVVVLAFLFAPDLFSDLHDYKERERDPDSGMSPEVEQALKDALSQSLPFLGVGSLIGLGWALFWISIVQRHAESLIWTALVATPLIFGVLTLAFLVMGNPAAVGFGVAFAITAIYAGWIITSQRFRIEFAQLTLETVAGVVRRHPGMWLSSFISILPAALWAFSWLFALAAVGTFYIKRGESFTYTDKYGNEREGYDIPTMGKILIAFLVLSNYWCAVTLGPLRPGPAHPHVPQIPPFLARRTAQVIMNVVHVTVSGTMAAWYFTTQSNMPSSPTMLSFKRAITTSFGSICLGSLLVALVQMIRDAVEDARRRQEGCVAMVIMCCLSCIVAWIEALIQLFNHFAFVQVAIYGKDFRTAAKDTWQLVQTKGITGLVNMNLTSQACGLGAIVGAALAAGTIALVAYFPLVAGHSDESDDVKGVFVGAYAIVIACTLLVSLIFTSMVNGSITSGVTTLFVCWAEDPVALRDTNAALHSKFEEISLKFLEDEAARQAGTQPPPPPAQGVYGQPMTMNRGGYQ